MATKLWEKNVQLNKRIEQFTVGRDRELDVFLAPYDVMGSMAHITMLESIGLLTSKELAILLPALKEIYDQAEAGHFVIEDGVEDVHSQVELMLTRKLGEAGKKIHSGRSRNDQVLLDLKLYARDGIHRIADSALALFDELHHGGHGHHLGAGIEIVEFITGDRFFQIVVGMSRHVTVNDIVIFGNNDLQPPNAVFGFQRVKILGE